MEELILRMADKVPLFMLIVSRTLALAIQCPYFGTQTVPIMVRVAISLSLSMLYIMSHPNIPLNLHDITIIEYIILLIKEFLVGALFGFSASVIVSAIQVGGEIVDVQVGLSMVQLLNPQTKTQTTVIGRFFYQVGLVILLLNYAHLFLLKVYFETFDTLPIGTFNYTSGLGIGALIEITGQIFVFGAQLALPIVVVVFVTDFGLGMMNRVAPQINILELNFAMKPTTGAWIVMLMFATLTSVMSDFSFKMSLNARKAITSTAHGIELRSKRGIKEEERKIKFPTGFPQYIDPDE